MMIVLSGKNYGMSVTDVAFATVRLKTRDYKKFRSRKLWNH